jgi:hypothetical protein
MADNVALSIRSLGPDVGFVDVKDLYKPLESVGPLAERIRRADTNGDGMLSKAEFRDLFAESLADAKRVKHLKLCFAALISFTVVVVAANVAMAVATAHLSRDVSVDMSGVMTVKGNSSTVVQTGTVLTSLIMPPEPYNEPLEELVQWKALTIPAADGSVVSYRISHVHVTPGSDLVVSTATGAILEVNTTGGYIDGTELGEQQAQGRRHLLQSSVSRPRLLAVVIVIDK